MNGQCETRAVGSYLSKLSPVGPDVGPILKDGALGCPGIVDVGVEVAVAGRLGDLKHGARQNSGSTLPKVENVLPSSDS